MKYPVFISVAAAGLIISQFVYAHGEDKPGPNGGYIRMPGAFHSEFLPRLNRIEGQLSGIQKMIQEGRYCVDILVQFRAAMAALRSIEVSVFERHLQHCLSSALLSKNKKQVDEKIQELTELLSRRSSL